MVLVVAVDALSQLMHRETKKKLDEFVQKDRTTATT